MPNKAKPTVELYQSLQTVYDYFNEKLFDAKLPEVVITLQREKNTMGYFSRDRWFESKLNKKTHEIAINPAYFASIPLIEILQTLAHEMCHLYQHEHGSPGRGRYHNTEFAQIMERIGLMTSSTGKPGGVRTGQQMSDYPIEGGRFATVCLALHEKGFFLPWVDRYPATKKILNDENEVYVGSTNTQQQSAAKAFQNYQENSLEVLYVNLVPPEAESEIVHTLDKEKIAKQNSKTRYQCQCGFNIWGKPSLSVRCNECETDFCSSNSV